MYQATIINVWKDDPIFDYCASVTGKGNNLYNASLFRIRQVMTGIKKDPKDRQPNEVAVLKEIEEALPSMQTKKQTFKMPTPEKWLLSYTFLDALFKRTNNPDYNAEGLPKHMAQNAIKEALEDMKGFFELSKMFKRNPSSLTGKPNLPHYKKSGGHCTVTSSKQESQIKKDQDGNVTLQLPLTKTRIFLPRYLSDAKLVEVQIKPYYNGYRISVITDNGKEPKTPKEERKRIIAIDLGVSNFAAITNNIGEPCLLFKGGVVKSTNQWYNKKMAQLKSEQTIGTKNKFKPTPESNDLCAWRDNRFRDLMHKYSKAIIQWSIDHNIDTIVVGENKGWKQNSNMGKENNQEFVSIPFTIFKKYLSYRSEAAGIKLIFAEESYTSKGSFLDRDKIPTYGKDDKDVSFSGLRGPTIYKGLRRPGN